MSRQKTEMCMVTHKRRYLTLTEAREDAKSFFDKTKIETYVYFCPGLPCVLSGVIHRTKRFPKGQFRLKLNESLFRYYENEKRNRNKGNKGKGSKEAKRRRQTLSRRRKMYLEHSLPMRNWEDDGGYIPEVHE